MNNLDQRKKINLSSFFQLQTQVMACEEEEECGKEMVDLENIEQRNQANTDSWTPI